MWFSFVLGAFYLVLYVNAQNIGGFCRTPTGESAKCVSVYKCEPLLSLLRAPSRTEEERKFLAGSGCGFDDYKVLHVCCGSGYNTVVTTWDDNDSQFTPNPLIPSRTQCGWQVENKIFNGEQADIDEFPWMAVIEYLTPSGRRRIACGGSLINQRYVLTAAHCLTGAVLTRVGQPINVRLGEYDTSSPGRDCFEKKGIKFCNEQEVNAGIQELVPHPGYLSNPNRFHDIGLIRLDRNIRYSDYIQPVCLPIPNESSQAGETLTVAGWGRTEKGKDSNVKLKLQVPVSSYSSCSNVFGRLSVKINSKSQICAGGENGKDSCTGDSGGPLMRTLPSDTTRWMIEGLVSYGYTECGSTGYPGVYTKVSRYLPWIHKNVKQ